MASEHSLREQLDAKKVQVESIVHKISVIVLSIQKLSQKLFKETAKIQHKINKVQFSRPRGNPANQWPHCPMTSRVHAFYQIKDRKERDLHIHKDLFKHIFNHDKAFLTSRRQVLENEQRDIECQVRIINIQLHQPINFDNLF